jgi:hypothetical protein
LFNKSIRKKKFVKQNLHLSVRIYPLVAKTDMGKPLFKVPDGGHFEILWEREDLAQSELHRGQERPCFSIRRFAPAFAEAASRRQAEAFPTGSPTSVWTDFHAISGSIPER